MPHPLQKGDKVSWRDHNDEEREGKIERMLVEETVIDGHRYPATLDSPMMVVQDHETHEERVKSPEELTRVGNEHRLVKE